MTGPEYPYRIGVISDTHGYLNPDAFAALAGVDLILHSGDIGRDDILTELEAIAPVQAVSGNADGAPQPHRPLQRLIETPAGRIAVAHGHMLSAPAYHRIRMAEHFREAAPAIVVYGHTHQRSIETIEGMIFFNPGAAGRSPGSEGPSVGMIVASGPDAPPVLEHIALREPPV